MFVEIRNAIQWAHTAKGARDPRMVFFSSLKRNTSIDPFSLTIIKKDDVLIISGKITYPDINIYALKSKKLKTKVSTDSFEVKIKDWDKQSAKIDIKPLSIFQISLDDMFVYWQFYLILTDKNKLKTLEKIIKE